MLHIAYCILHFDELHKSKLYWNLKVWAVADIIIFIILFRLKMIFNYEGHTQVCIRNLAIDL